MMKDFKLLRDCPYSFLVDPVLEAMMEKWSNVYKEEKLAESWYKEWSHLAFSRITLNETIPFLADFHATIILWNLPTVKTSSTLI